MSTALFDAASPPIQTDESCRRICLVEGCTVDVSHESSYCRQKRVCTEHRQADSVRLAGSDELVRFCQQCGKLEVLSAFDESKRSCRVALAKRRANHRLAHGSKKPAPAASASAAMSEPLAGLDFIPVTYAPTATFTEKLPDMPMLEAAAAGGATAAVGPSAADMTFVAAPGVYGTQLEQQLQMYQQKCAVLRMQIQQLEEEQMHSQSSMGAAAHQGQHNHQSGSLAGAKTESCGAAATNLCSPDTAMCRDATTYVPMPGTGSGAWWAAQAYPLAAAAGACIARDGSSVSTSMYFPARNDSCSLLLPQHVSASNSASFASAPLLSPLGAGMQTAAMQSLQQQQLWLQQQQAAMQPKQGFASESALAGAARAGACMSPAGFSPAGLSPARAVGADSTCFSAGVGYGSGSGEWGWQQQMMGPPAHVQQMLPAQACGMSAPLPAGWAGGSFTSGSHSAGLVPLMPHMYAGTGMQASAQGAGMQAHAQAGAGGPMQGAGGAMQGAGGSAGAVAASQAVMVLGEDDGCDIMDCDSADDIAGLLEMSLLEAGMKARMGAAGMA